MVGFNHHTHTHADVSGGVYLFNYRVGYGSPGMDKPENLITVPHRSLPPSFPLLYLRLSIPPSPTHPSPSSLSTFVEQASSPSEHIRFISHSEYS